MKQKLPSWLWAIITAVIIIILGLIDWVTGYEFNFFVFYFIPISIAAWYFGLGASLAVSVLCTVVWATADVFSGHAHSTNFYFYWNTVIRLASFMIIGLALSKIRQLLDQQFKLSKDLKQSILELQKASSEIKILSGLLPICASCKKIRDDKGYWNQIESYISDHSEAEFSHGICPECMKKLYPDVYTEMQKAYKREKP